ncbi:MAG: isoprenyl transferase [Acholeplasmatales bacterium]|nr:isoprenyl transferase [Acholeplasmatales bacterium]
MAELDLTRIPNHVAIILDGNGRWAKERGKPRIYGHRHGAFNLRDVAKYANSIGVKYLTVYCFSTENWKRPDDEVNFLMNTPVWYIKRFWKTMVENTNIRYKMIGRRDRLPKKLLQAIEEMEEASKNHTGLTLSLAIDYGSRDEITTAVKKIATEVKENKLNVSDINEDLITNNLFTKDYPPLDLMIRTSGEYRISNFLLWQLAYSEFYFTNTYFPDFTPEKFKEALIDFQSRNRRFGGLK